MLYKEHDVNRNAWSKVAEKIAFHTKCKCDTNACKYKQM